jgi:hypothetical protein
MRLKGGWDPAVRVQIPFGTIAILKGNLALEQWVNEGKSGAGVGISETHRRLVRR